MRYPHSQNKLSILGVFEWVYELGVCYGKQNLCKKGAIKFWLTQQLIQYFSDNVFVL